MSKFCVSCGAQLADNADFCTTCGAKQSAAQPQGAQQIGGQPHPGAQQVNGAAKNFADAAKGLGAAAGQNVKQTFDGVSFDSVKGAMSINDIKNVGKTKNKNTIIGLAAIAVAIVLVIIILCCAITPGWQKPIDRRFKAMNKCDGSLYAKTFADAYNDYVDEHYVSDDDDYDSIEEYYEEQLNDIKDYAEDEYGDNVKYKVKVLKKKELKKSDLKDVEDRYEDYYDESVDVSKGYKVKLKITVKGKDDDDTDNTWMNVYKIDGKWVLDVPLRQYWKVPHRGILKK